MDPKKSEEYHELGQRLFDFYRGGGDLKLSREDVKTILTALALGVVTMRELEERGEESSPSETLEPEKEGG